jgi:CRP-like cAMP-binding protein
MIEHDQYVWRHAPLQADWLCGNTTGGTDLAARDRPPASLWRPRTLPAQLDLIGQGRRSDGAFALRKGWAYSAVTLHDGRRQILDFHLPGEFLGLHTLVLAKSDRSYTSLTAVEVSQISPTAFAERARCDSEVAAFLSRHLSEQCVGAAKQLANLGCRNAMERLAYRLCDIALRLTGTDCPEQLQVVCPITQEHLADATGLTVVYVNRILKQFGHRGLLTMRFGRLSILDFRTLAALAGIELHPPPVPNALHLGNLASGLWPSGRSTDPARFAAAANCGDPPCHDSR